MAYDSTSNKILLYGGFDTDGRDDETWEYDVVTDTWMQMSLSTKPSARIQHAMAYDSANNKVVLFGGHDGTRDDETWIFNINDYYNTGNYTSKTYTANNLKWHTITWATNTDPDSFIRFQVAVNNEGKSWNYIGPDGSSSAFYDENTGGNLYSGYSGKYLRYKAYFTTPSAGNAPVLYEVSISSITEGPSVKLTSPNGGEDWMRNKWYPITWNAEGVFDFEPINLYFSTDNGANWTLIEQDVRNYGFYNWTVPNIETANALILVRATDIYGNRARDTSDASFAIDPPPPGAGGSPSDGDGTQFPEDDQPGAEVEDPGGGAGESNVPEGLDPELAIGIVILGIILAISIIFNFIFISRTKNTNKKKIEKKKNTTKIGVRHEQKK
jgi:hypothetical protein